MRRFLAALCVSVVSVCAQAQHDGMNRIKEQIRTLRAVPDDKRAEVTRNIALEIRALPASAQKVSLATALSSLSTEGDFGHATLQAVATTLAQSIEQVHPSSEEAYAELARLAHYENVNAAVNAPKFKAALAQLEATDRARQQADFTLHDLNGKPWTLSQLRGKVVLVNFWATWCPPCRKEMPDLEALQKRFGKQRLVILGISDEGAAKVKPFIAEHHYTYTILLDPGRRVHAQFRVEGIPQTVVYDRQGKMAAQAADMRTRGQFVQMLKRAGL